jgi:hypothetical protein
VVYHGYMRSWEDSQLEDLRWHWGEAYLIHYFPPGKWVAQRRDSHSSMSADSPEGLRELIAVDYIARPVGRQAAGCRHGG